MKYFKYFDFNNFLISQYSIKNNISKYKTFYLFFKNRVFEYIDKYFRVIISLPLDDVIESLHKCIIHNRKNYNKKNNFE